ncbi:hypothetical protein PybrP1_000758 [[Pythium] brassicae (nom. inval.)]|nr:hypothetical protein PybrP1_000758 [[Pythium] brassicae (nom. inval.)]
MVDLLGQAVKLGHLDVVRWLHECIIQRSQVPRSKRSPILLSAILNGHIDVARFLVDNDYQLVEGINVSYSQRCIDLKMLTWLQSRGLTDGSTGWTDKAAEAGRLDVLQWLDANMPDDRGTTRAMDEAACNGHFEVVKWLHANRQEGCTSRAIDKAALGGHLDVVKWLHENRQEGCTTGAMDNAAANNHLDVVKWLHENRQEGCTTSAMDGAATYDHLDVVQWLHKNRQEGCTTDAMDGAAANGYLRVVKWLHENRSEGCTTRAQDETQSMEVLRWLRDHRSEGCTNGLMVDAVRRGDFEKLLYSVEKKIGQGYLGRVIETTVRNFQFEVFQWLRVNFPEHNYEATARFIVEFHMPRGTRLWDLFFEDEAARKQEAKSTKTTE